MRAGLSNYVNYQIHEDVAVICMTAPPVNSLGPDLRAALMETFEQADRDSKVVAVVLTGSLGCLKLRLASCRAPGERSDFHGWSV